MDFLPLNDGCLKRDTGDFDNAARLKLLNILDGLSDLRAHSEQHSQHRCSGIVQTNIANEQMTTALRSSGNQPKSR